MSVLEVTGLSTELTMQRTVIRPVNGVDLSISSGETVGLVGESGCGKSITGLSILGLLPKGGAVVDGSIRLNGRPLVGLPEREMRALRGNDIAMIFQDSQSSLNPTKSIGEQVAEPVRIHRGASRLEAKDRALEVLQWVGFPDPRERYADYPHQLSGGLRQRVMIAIALVCEPKVLIADEPTTALDVTTQGQILTLLDDLKERLGMVMLLVTHDLGVVAGRADRTVVMYAGQVVETCATERLFQGMRHPYSQGLLASIPRLESDPDETLFSIGGQPPELTRLPQGCRFAARCMHADEQCLAASPPLAGTEDHRFACWHPVDGPAVALAKLSRPKVTSERSDANVLRVDNVVKEFPVTVGGLRNRGRATVKAVTDVSLTLGSGETLGLVGESGCGKTTLGRMIVGLERAPQGSVRLDGDDIFARRGRSLRVARRNMQMMFQDSFASLNPRMRIGAILREPLWGQEDGSRADQDRRIHEILGEVGFPPSILERYPHEMSGGQRQRIGLARALMHEPTVLVADEPVSALDVSIRSQVLNLMKRFQRERGMASIVISHDLAVVKYLADRIGVMYLGRLVELAPATELYERPAHPYTAGLIDAIPIPDPEVERSKAGATISGELPSAINPPSGCPFRTRCPRASDICSQQMPELQVFGAGHVAACHSPLIPTG